MEVSALLDEFRRRADDRVTPYFTEDEDAIRFAAEAEREAAMRARLIYDASTPEVAVYAITEPGNPVVTLSPLVYHIDAASWQPSSAGRAQTVCLTGIDWIRSQHAWRTRTGSYVTALAHLERNQVHMYPAPSQAGTLSLAVYRLPLYELEDIGDEPEIAEEHHLGLVDWMLYRHFSMADGEIEDTQRAQNALNAFTERFGERNGARVMRKHRERRRVTTRYGGC